MKRTFEARLNRCKHKYAILALCASTAVALPAQTFHTLLSFNGPDGVNPYAKLIQATNGAFYGTTFQGGANGGFQGTVFEFTPHGGLHTLHSFVGTDGAFPYAGLVQVANGNFYGTTQAGGSSTMCINGCGTIFRITPKGVLSSLYSFCSKSNCADGASPEGGLIQGADGNLYGVTTSGGTGVNCADFQPTGCGTVFKMTLAGTLTTLHSFNFTDGYEPWGTLVQTPNGTFYGTTSEGVVSGNPACGFGCGTIFEMSPSGKVKTLHVFQGTDGAFPLSGLIRAANGTFYGTTSAGGPTNSNCFDGCGTLFSMTASGTLTTLYFFNSTDGAAPYAPPVLASDGNLYGTTTEGGVGGTCIFGCGTLFEFNLTAPAITTLYNFCSEASCADGDGPADALLQGADGAFYGTAFSGGAFQAGTIFRLSVGP